MNHQIENLIQETFLDSESTLIWKYEDQDAQELRVLIPFPSSINVKTANCIH